MGLFSFLKNSGAKVLTKKNAKAIADNPEIKRMEEEILNKQVAEAEDKATQLFEEKERRRFEMK